MAPLSLSLSLSPSMGNFSLFLVSSVLVSLVGVGSFSSFGPNRMRKVLEKKGKRKKEKPTSRDEPSRVEVPTDTPLTTHYNERGKRASVYKKRDRNHASVTSTVATLCGAHSHTRRLWMTQPSRRPRAILWDRPHTKDGIKQCRTRPSLTHRTNTPIRSIFPFPPFQ